MKIGIITYHRSHNYGAYMQSYALVNAINERYAAQGINAEVIDISTVKARNFYIKEIIKEIVKFGRIKTLRGNIKQYWMFCREVKKLPLSKMHRLTDDQTTFSRLVKGQYDVIITGSDEVWKYGFRGFPNYYWLPGDLKCKKFAYAVSSRNNLSKLSNEVQEKMKEFMLDFDYIGVRDEISLNNVLDLLHSDKNVHKNCDPVFLYDFCQNHDKGRLLIKKHYQIDPQKKTICLMMGLNSISDKIVNHLIERYGDKYNFISLYTNFSDLPFYPECTPFEWANIIAGSDFLITTYFHGMCFAIKSGTPFFSIECRPGAKCNGKNYDILNEMDLLDRYGYIEDDYLSQLDYYLDSDIGVRMDYNALCEAQKQKSHSFFERLEGLLSE